MRTFIRAFLLFALTIVISSFFPLNAQVAVVDYMKVQPENLGRYLELENKWKKIHEVRLEHGRIINWGTYEVMFTGTADPYNYAAVTVYENLDMFDNSWDFTFFTEAYPEMNDQDISEFYEETYASRDLSRTVVLNLIMETETSPEDIPTYILVNGMKITPGRDADYIAMEKDIFKPLHEESIKQKQRAGWSVWEKFYGNYTDYQYVTLDGFYSFQQSGLDRTGEIFAKLHSDSDWEEILNQADKTRSIVFREIWRLIEYLDAED